MRWPVAALIAALVASCATQPPTMREQTHDACYVGSFAYLNPQGHVAGLGPMVERHQWSDDTWTVATRTPTYQHTGRHQVSGLDFEAKDKSLRGTFLGEPPFAANSFVDSGGIVGQQSWTPGYVWQWFAFDGGYYFNSASKVSGTACSRTDQMIETGEFVAEIPTISTPNAGRQEVFPDLNWPDDLGVVVRVRFTKSEGSGVYSGDMAYWFESKRVDDEYHVQMYPLALRLGTFPNREVALAGLSRFPAARLSRSTGEVLGLVDFASYKARLKAHYIQLANLDGSSAEEVEKTMAGITEDALLNEAQQILGPMVSAWVGGKYQRADLHEGRTLVDISIPVAGRVRVKPRTISGYVGGRSCGDADCIVMKVESSLSDPLFGQRFRSASWYSQLPEMARLTLQDMGVERDTNIMVVLEEETSLPHHITSTRRMTVTIGEDENRVEKVGSDTWRFDFDYRNTPEVVKQMRQMESAK